MWSKSTSKMLVILLGFFSIAPWPADVHAFEMDDSNETMAEHFRDVTSGFDIQKEIKEQIKKSFTNPYADSEIELGDYEGEEDSFRISTYLPPAPTTDEYRQDALIKINEYRKEHCAPPLTMNLWLNTQADTYAQHVLMSQAFIPEVAGTRLGENRYVKRLPYGLPPPTNKGAILSDAIECWYQERYDYDFDNPVSHFRTTLNFTNMVWKSTQHVGLGLASNDEELLIVALFYPPGNNVLLAHQNVMQSEKEKTKEELKTPSEALMKMMEHSNLYL